MCLCQESKELDDALQVAIDSQNTFAVAVIYITKSFWYTVAGDYESTLKMVDGRVKWLSRMDGSMHEALGLYLEGLAAFGAARRTKRPEQVKRANHAMRMLGRLAKQNPSSCLAKHILLEAEHAALSGKHTMAKEKYSHAISMAARYKSHYELAFANQAAADFYIVDMYDTGTGQHYLKEACKAYEAWGGLAAISHLTKRIQDLESQQ